MEQRFCFHRIPRIVSITWWVKQLFLKSLMAVQCFSFVNERIENKFIYLIIFLRGVLAIINGSRVGLLILKSSHGIIRSRSDIFQISLDWSTSVFVYLAFASWSMFQSTRQPVNWNWIHITNSMAYETRRFNVAFIRALQ